MIDLGAFEVMTFDCYGTLIDWETGLLAAIAPVLAAHRVSAGPDEILVGFGAAEAEVEAGPYRPYREVLSCVLDRLGAALGFVPSPGEREAFGASVPDWPAFPDAAKALATLRSRHRLGVISNVDDDLFAPSARRLGDPFTWVVTAQQVRAYKPSLAGFRRMLDTAGVPPARVVHVAQSRYHDVEPAKRLGLATVWVDRRRGKAGDGATPPSDAVADLEVADLAELTSS